MKCGNCPIKADETYIITPEGEQVDLIECPFGDHALHLWDHRCTKLKQRKERVESIQNEGVEYANNTDD